jgi:hypothetical protein
MDKLTTNNGIILFKLIFLEVRYSYHEGYKTIVIHCRPVLGLKLLYLHFRVLQIPFRNKDSLKDLGRSR